MKNFNIVSFDDGFGDNKGYNGEKLVRIPTAYADWRPKPTNTFKEVKSIEEDDQHYDTNIKYLALYDDSGEYIVGESALKQSLDISWYGGVNKHEDIGFPLMMKSCLGLLTSYESSVIDLLMMGLPCTSDNEVRRKQLERMILSKHHKFQLELANGKKLNRDIHVRNLIIKKQPFGSFCDLLLDESGNIANTELANGFVTVVDIGSRTLNIYTLNRMEEVDDLIDTTNNGMYTSYIRVGKFIEDKMNFKIPTGKLPLIVKEREFNGYDLSSVIDKSHKMLAYEIKKIIDTMMINAYGYLSNIIFTGGGAEVLRYHLVELFQDKNILILDRYATARGLWKYGLFKSPQQPVVKEKTSNGGIKVRVGVNE